MMGNFSTPPMWRYAYLLLYPIGAFCSFVCVSLLGWIAFCIALEKEPMASVSFLSWMPTFVVFLALFAIMAIGVASWQYGAKYHERYEEYLKKQR